MKLIKTYWHSLHKKDNQPFYLDIKREPLYLFALSSHMLLEHQPVELFTDAAGARMIEKIHIPFTKIHVTEPVSTTWKSVNDLQVLCMQQEPAALVDDNLLAVGKIDLQPHSQAMTLLGIDLNSLKTTKAMIKMMRIDEKIPLLDETLWLDKMAYIDASLLGASDMDVLKQYFSAVKLFVSKHSSALSKIEPSCTEDFIRRYWLYSYCLAKGVSFDMYFNDPLKVVYEPLDIFGFSTKNVFGNFIRVMDNYFNDALFNLHFFRYFDLRFRETLDAIRVSLELFLDKNGKADGYIRSREAWQKIYPANTKKRPALTTIRKSIAENETLKDIYEYETVLHEAKKQYVKNTPDIYEQQRTAFAQLLKNWDSPPGKFCKLAVAVNPWFCVTESNWKWSTRWVEGVAIDKLAELKVIYNLTTDRSYYITGFLPDAEHESAHEFNLDKRSAEIIAFFTETKTIDEFINGMDNDSKQAYFNRIKDLLLINILYIDGA